MTPQTGTTTTTEQPTREEVARLMREIGLYLTFWAKAREPETRPQPS